MSEMTEEIRIGLKGPELEASWLIMKVKTASLKGGGRLSPLFFQSPILFSVSQILLASSLILSV